VNTPLVSILIPTYNRPEYLRRAVESCLAQTYHNFEIVITDNSTNQDSARTMAKYTDLRIRYHSNGGNIGPWESPNRAISLAQGAYIKFLMDDDLLKPSCLALMVEALEKHPTAGIAMAPMELIDEQDRRIFPRFYVFRRMTYRYRYQIGDGLVDRKKALREFLTKDYPCCVPSGTMYRAAAVRDAGPFDQRSDFAGDLDMCMRIVPYYDCYYIDQVLTSWRFASSSHTTNLHLGGLNVGAFYFVTRRCLDNPVTRVMFHDEWDKLFKDSLFFCSCRALLNGLAAVRARSPRLLFATMRQIMREDPYVTNWLRLPFFALREIFVSIFPPRWPPAREESNSIAAHSPSD
jgi:glycosyltransferase involved in cell wall biosynthesis